MLGTALGWKNRGIPGAGIRSDKSAVVAVVIGGVTLPEGDARGDAGGCALDGEAGEGCTETAVSVSFGANASQINWLFVSIAQVQNTGLPTQTRRTLLPKPCIYPSDALLYMTRSVMLQRPSLDW